MPGLVIVGRCLQAHWEAVRCSEVVHRDGPGCSDGAAAVVVTSRAKAEELGAPVLAEIGAHGVVAGPEPSLLSQPSNAILKALGRAGKTPKDVDLYEINEAFAVVTMAAMKEHGLPHEKVNVHGGACALGHPIGASGARIVVTLIGALRKYGLKRGVASLCIGGGEATAMALELP